MAKNHTITVSLTEQPSTFTDLKSFSGFTLAEVLITLVIIGVIAAMTIPTLINKTNNQEYVSRLKKAYSAMAQATNKIITDEGNPNASIGGWATSPDAIYEMYKKYLSKAKDCGTNNDECFGQYLRMDGTVLTVTSAKALVMADGTKIAMGNGDFSDNCSKRGNGSEDVCQFIMVDVNGSKGPNRVGRDTFHLALKADGIFPAGCDYDGGCSSTTKGWGCACKVIRENAMNY